MKLPTRIYNAEIAHCPGAKSRKCLICLRMQLYKIWSKMKTEDAEAIILLPPRVEGSDCRMYIKSVSNKIMPNSDTGKNTPVRVITTASGMSVAV